MFQRIKGKAIADEKGIRVVVTDETMDRSGESLPITDWDLSNFTDAPRMFVDHDYSVESIVGVWKDASVEDGQLVMTPVFHDITELARTVGEMVKQGFLNTVSVGFIRRRVGEKTINELLEVSFVGVPCNPSARVQTLSAKELMAKTTDDEHEQVQKFVADFSAAIKGENAQAAEEQEAKPEEQTEAAPVVPAQEEEKGMTEDALDEARELTGKKYQAVDPVMFAYWDFLDAFFLASVPVEAFPTLARELTAKIEAIAAAFDAASPSETDTEEMQKRFVNFAKMRGWIKENTQENSDAKSENDAETKAGRVISEKTRGIIQTSLDTMAKVNDAMGEATAALGALIEEPAQSSEEESLNEGESKSDEIEEQKKQLEEIAQKKRVVKMIVTQLNEALGQLKMPRS